MSEGLKRAREPFRVRNALTGVGIAAFVVGIWAYSISAVKQDVFDDLDEEARALGAGSSSDTQPRSGPTAPATNSAGLDGGGANTTITTAGGGLASLKPVKTPAAIVAEARATTVNASTRSGRGLLAAVLEQYFPRALDPQTRTLVWGAPAVDNIGRLKDGRKS